MTREVRKSWFTLIITFCLSVLSSITFGTELYYSDMSTVSDWIEASNAGNEDGDGTGGIRVVNGDKVQMNSWWNGAEWTEISKNLGHTIQTDKMYTLTVNMISYAASAAVDLKLQNVTESSDIAINVVNPATSGFNNYSVAFSTAQGQNSGAVGDTLGISIYGGWWNNLAVTDVTVEEVDDTGGLSESYTIDLTTRYQQVTGFGAGTIFYANHLIDGLPPEYRENTYQKLFGDLNHAYHMFWFRADVESSNDNSDPYDVDLGGFSFGANQDRFVTILNESLTRNPDVTIAVTIMSPPAWLKTNGSVNGGGTLDTSVNNAYEEFGEFAFANLLWFKQQGISVDILNLMNEPDEVLSGQEDASYTATQSRDVHKYTVDHIRYLINSSENTAGVVMPLIMMPSTCDAAKANSFINECKSDGAAWDNVDIVAVHHYYETATAGYQAIYDNIEGKPLIMSEWHSAWGGDIGPGMTEIMQQSTAIITSMKGGIASFWWFETNHPVDSVTGLCWQPWWAETVFGQTYDSWRQWADLTPVDGDRVQVNKGGGGMGLTDIAFDKSSIGMVTLVVLNKGADQYIDVSVTSESMSHIDYYHTTETDSYTLVSSSAPDPSQETFLVEAESLNMFVITYDQAPPVWPLVFQADFEDNNLDAWQATDPSAWRIENGHGGKVLSLFKDSTYSPPFRSPYNINLVRDVAVNSFTLDMEMLSTNSDYDHRDLCLFFGYQDPAHFYYVHFGKTADPHANSIFIVDDADRVSIADYRTNGTPWDNNWHSARLVRNADTGRIEVYFDDMTTPVMTSINHRFRWGRVGVGSFDDIGQFDDIQLRGHLWTVGDFVLPYGVGLADFAVLANQWLQPPASPSADIAPPGGDGIVDINDLAALAENWGTATTIPPLPEPASNPNPPDDALISNLDVDLSWTAGPYTASHDVYFGTNGPPPFIRNQTSTTFDPGTMAYYITYYWRIDEVNTSGKTTGTVWSFTIVTTPPPPP